MWHPVHVIALMIAATVCLFMVFIGINVIVTGKDLEPHSEEILESLLDSMITITSTYIGYILGRGTAKDVAND